jgi:hypothetical protein
MLCRIIPARVIRVLARAGEIRVYDHRSPWGFGSLVGVSEQRIPPGEIPGCIDYNRPQFTKKE